MLKYTIDKFKMWDSAMVTELKSLGDLGLLKIIHRPSEAHLLQSTWNFKRKRYLDGQLRYYKVRFCVRGDRQVEGINVFGIYAPVLSWITVRLLFVLSLVINLDTQQVDYMAAFCQPQFMK